MIKARDLATLGMLAAVLLPTCSVEAIKDKTNQGRWTKPTVNNLPDKEVPGFLVNLGPTGARAILTETTFIVKHLFKGSPADGRLRLDDVITGVFGRPFSSHSFGGSPHGYEGPLMDLGLGIEKAEGKDGKLVLNVSRGRETLEVKIDLEALGSFSAAFPLQCRKSELLRAKALKYLADSTDAQAVWQAHAKSAVTLALLSSDLPAQQALGRKMALGWNSIPGPGTWTWGVSFQLMTLSEYHLLSGDATVLPTIKALSTLLRQDQYDGRILAWGPGEVKGDYAAIDAAQQLYQGGFGHAPYVSGVGKNGYGPMQYTTIFAVIAWQLGERCGVKADPRGLKNALEFIHRGTNAAGYVAYGGEFTLNNGLIDPVAWKKSKDGDNYVGRAGASLVAHKLSPEFPASAEVLDLNRGYLKRAYKSLPDGHADSNLGILWGLMGAAASEDESALRSVLDYHKAWFNMMRCHDGSFVLLPGRDYADEGYYMASRYHPTATMALVLGLGFPKLQIQGVQVSIPGVNPKVLQGSPLAAYKSICAKSYGDAARTLKSAGPDAAPMSAYLEAHARKVLEALEVLGKAGRFVDLQQRLQELRKSHAGIPVFDEGAASWDATLKGKAGSAVLAADKLSGEGHHGKALAALQPALSSEQAPAAKAVEERILGAARWTVASWDAMEKAGEWQRLRKDIDLQKERYRGIGIVDDRVQALDASLGSDPGRIMVEADRQLADGAAGPALTALGALDTAPAKALRARAEEAAQKALATLEAFEKEGRWLSLKDGLAKARPKMAGLAAFEERAKAWETELSGPSGRAWIAAEKSFAQGDLGAAAKSAPPELLKRIEESAREQLKPLQDLETKGDWYALEKALAALKKKLSGLPG
ncbi:MAG: hypothetical protein HY293_16035, partial [Planctomycetes bacterium]|nr:hypothetical protein [Planctomycetota bacterium]